MVASHESADKLTLADILATMNEDEGALFLRRMEGALHTKHLLAGVQQKPGCMECTEGRARPVLSAHKQKDPADQDE